MSICQTLHLSKSYGVLRLFEDINLTIHKGQKVGLIAPNGSGKSTLLKIIAGIEPADEGEVVFQKDTRVAYLPQLSRFDNYPDILSACMSGIRPELREVLEAYERAVVADDNNQLARYMEEMEALNAWEIERELTSLLSQLKIDNPLRTTEGLSGGECKRIALASVLIDAPDLLILDEPTNHLDPEMIEWLEEYLAAQQLSLLMVTHDRYFLDKVCDTIIEMEQGGLVSYEGNYSKYLVKRDERMEQLNREQQALRNLYKRELEWMRRMPQARATKAKYRKEAFYETEAKLRHIQQAEGPKMEASSVYIGKKIFEAEGLRKEYDGRTIISNFTYNFARRDRVGVIGRNGVGKSTLVGMILGEIAPDAGHIEVGETVRFGHFSQSQASYPPGKKVIEVITDKADRVLLADGSTLSAMQLLNKFLFPPARQQDYVEKLSGGELRRLQLCAMLMEAPNFLVLDEPTNDLDIPTLQVLEEYLRNFDGCVLIVSHDRYFMDTLVSHLFVLKGDGLVSDFPGNYSEYRLQEKQEMRTVTNKSVPAPSPKPQRERSTPKKRTYKEQREYEELERELPRIEALLQQLEEEMSSGVLDGIAIQERGARYQSLQKQLDEKEVRWLELSEIGE